MNVLEVAQPLEITKGAVIEQMQRRRDVMLVLLEAISAKVRPVIELIVRDGREVTFAEGVSHTRLETIRYEDLHQEDPHLADTYRAEMNKSLDLFERRSQDFNGRGNESVEFARINALLLQGAYSNNAEVKALAKLYYVTWSGKLERLRDSVDAQGQFFDTAPRAETLGEFFGERGKPGYVSVKRRAMGPVRESFAAR